MQETAPSEVAPVPSMTPAELHQEMDRHGELTVIDVRGPHETSRGTIPGAVLIPLGEIESRLPPIPPTERIVVYCQEGKRSLEAARKLRALGFACVASLEGGYQAWHSDM